MSHLGMIHRFQPATSPETRTLLVLHGTGGDEMSLVPIARSVLPGAAVLSPRGSVSENGMPRFFRRFAEGVFDLEDLKARAHELADFISAASHEYGFDPSAVTAFGYSNGANIAWTTMLLRPESIVEAVLLRPMVTLEEPSAADLSGKRILVLSGRYDPIVPTDNVERLVETMRSLGATVEFRWHEGGHEISGDELDTARGWLGLT
jgi:predicted esterase